MNVHLTEIRDKQKETWNSFSGGWKKWDAFTMEYLKPWADEIVRMLAPKDGDVVLDIAAGTGEPGLTIARMVGQGRVVITDLAESMVVTAREKAADYGLTNVETLACDVSELPFEDNTFDAISCRFGFMFFPDMKLAASELYRVLKPGGRIATAVWGKPEKNAWFTTLAGVIAKNVEVPKPAPGDPGMFRCAEAGVMAAVFGSAGFKNITESEIDSRLASDSSTHYWNFMSEVVAPVALGQDERLKEIIKNELMAMLDAKYPSGSFTLDSSAVVVYGEK